MFSVVCILLALIKASQSSARASSTPSENYNLTSILAAQPLLTNFTAVLTNYTSLFDLVANGNCTVLAPSDNATVPLLAQGNSGDLEAVLSYHILPGIYTPVEFVAGLQFYPTYLTDPNYANVTGGQRVGAYATNEGIFFESGLKTKSHLMTANIVYSGPDLTGVIHIIDRALQIPKDQGTTVEKVEFSGVIPAAILYPINPALDGISGPTPDWTGFVPNSSIGLGPDLSTKNAYDAESYHFAQGSVMYSPDLKSGMSIQTLEGHNITVTVAPNGTKYVNDVEIISTDYLITTGVLHIIDHALNPNRTDARPAFINATTPTPQAPASVSSSHSSSLSTGAKVGIGVGVTAGVVFTIGLAIWCIAGRTRQGGGSQATKEVAQPGSLAHDGRLYYKHEMSVTQSGQEWEMDGVEPQRQQRYEMP